MDYTAEQLKEFVDRYHELCVGGMQIIDAFRDIGNEYGQRAMWAMVDELMRRGMQEGCEETRTILMNGPKLYEWQELWDAMELQFCGRILGEDEWFAKPEGDNHWTPTTEYMWNNQLNSLPPRATGGGAFLVGEAWNHTSGAVNEAIYACFACINGKFYARYLTLKMFRAETQRDTLPKAA